MYDLKYGVSGLERGWTNKKWEVFDHITSPGRAYGYVSRGTCMTWSMGFLVWKGVGLTRNGRCLILLHRLVGQTGMFHVEHI
jgi:hypothetical protein